jgi:hypothetical protein
MFEDFFRPETIILTVETFILTPACLQIKLWKNTYTPLSTFFPLTPIYESSRNPFLTPRIC